MKCVYLALVFALFSVEALAQQTSFQRKYREAHIIMNFAWRDADHQPQTLAFALPIDAAQQGNQEFQPFDNRAANTAAFKAMQAYANQYPGLSVNRSIKGFNVQFEGPAYHQQTHHNQQLEDIQTEAYKADITRQFYVEHKPNMIMPDHAHIAQRYTRAMRPVAKAIAKQTRGKSQRETINYTLNFLQTIPYDILQNRYTSNGAGFQTPYGLLLNNTGDCDTKTVALAAILRNLYPNLQLAMVYVPDHAFLGIKGTPTRSENGLRIGPDRTPYVLVDPTGPAQVKMGDLSTETLTALRNQEVFTRKIPR